MMPGNRNGYVRIAHRAMCTTQRIPIGARIMAALSGAAVRAIGWINSEGTGRETYGRPLNMPHLRKVAKAPQSTKVRIRSGKGPRKVRGKRSY